MGNCLCTAVPPTSQDEKFLHGSKSEEFAGQFEPFQSSSKKGEGLWTATSKELHSGSAEVVGGQRQKSPMGMPGGIAQRESQNGSVGRDLEWSTPSNSSSGGGSWREEEPLEVTEVMRIEPSDVRNLFEFEGELGRGQFGVTFLCRDRESKELLACKSILKSSRNIAAHAEGIRREVSIMRHLPPHPNIVSLWDVHEDETAVHLVMEYCRGGELFQRIMENRRYTEVEAAKTIEVILEVVQWFHKHNVMHRDLKPENFLLGHPEKGHPMKAIDFGLSCFFVKGQRFQEVVGSPYYMAPEVMEKDYGPEVDMWSAGVILYILLCGAPPFSGGSDRAVMMAVRTQKLDLEQDPWPWISPSAKSLVAAMLDRDPTQRLTATQALAHPWLKEAAAASRTLVGDRVIRRLQCFFSLNLLQQHALKAIVAYVTEDFIVFIHNLFVALLGNNKRTFMEATALVAAVQEMGCSVSEQELSQLVRQVDESADGTVVYESFLAATMNRRLLATEGLVRHAFNSFDRHKRGRVWPEEVRSVLEEIAGPLPEKAFQDIRSSMLLQSRDGTMTFEAFQAMMLQLSLSAAWL